LLNNALALDDTVFWGALPMLADSRDEQIQDCAKRLRERRLPKCIDIRRMLASEIGLGPATEPRARDELKKKLERLVASVETKLKKWAQTNSTGAPRILTDRATRDPYRRFEESKGPLNQIHIRLSGRDILDVASCSSVIAAIESFELFRAYTDDEEARSVVENVVKAELRRN
jgi:hypothetical protein